MPSRDQRLPLPATLSPAQCDFYGELRRLIDVGGLTCRALETVTSVPPGSGEAAFYSKSRWGRWVNGQSQPPRKAIKILAERLAGDEIEAGHLLELWDGAFAPPPPPVVEARPVAEAQPAAEPPQGRDSAVAGQLAALVAGECAAELNDRVLQGWQPLAVSWQPAAGPVDPEAASAVPPGDTGDVGPLARFVREGRRLVVTGPGGAGKSTLAVLLMNDLLGRRRPGDPVPVLVPASTVAPGEMMKGWLERTLADRYPPLRDARAYGAEAIAGLVAQRRVLPVIDGLDDLEPHARGQLLGALSRAFGPCQPLILTCRGPEYREAVEAAGTVLPGGAVIELRAVAGEDAARFLERGSAGPRARSLRPVVDAIRARPSGPLALALSSPLMVALARAGAAASAGLARQDDQAAVESQLLDGLIGASFGARATSEQARPDQPWDARDAERWLALPGPAPDPVAQLRPGLAAAALRGGRLHRPAAPRLPRRRAGLRPGRDTVRARPRTALRGDPGAALRARARAGRRPDRRRGLPAGPAAVPGGRRAPRGGCGGCAGSPGRPGGPSSPSRCRTRSNRACGTGSERPGRTGQAPRS